MFRVILPVLAAALFMVASANAQEATPSRYPPSSVRSRLVAGGLAVTGLAYGGAFLAASSWPDAPGANELKIPVVGPWLALANNGCAKDDPDCGFILYFRGFLTFADGLLQLGGLGIAAEGIFMTTESDAAPRAKPTGLRFRPAPVVVSRSVGLGVVGTF